MPTLEGSVNIKIPPGTPNGKVFRVKGKGVKPERGQPGDLYARAEVVVPRKVSRRGEEAPRATRRDRDRGPSGPFQGDAIEREASDCKARLSSSRWRPSWPACTRRRCASTSAKGLIDPYRTPGGTRRYSQEDIERLTLIQTLTSQGLNLEGRQAGPRPPERGAVAAVRRGRTPQDRRGDSPGRRAAGEPDPSVLPPGHRPQNRSAS